MIIHVTVNSTACLLMAAEPPDGCQWTLQRISSWHASKTRIEERMSLGATLRNKLAFTVPYLDQASAALFFASLRDPNNKPVLCPLWTAATQYGVAQLATSALRITWEPEFSTYQIHTGASPVAWTPSALAKSAPLLWGRFDKPFGGAELDNAELFDAKLEWMETGPESDPIAYAVTPVAAVPVGPMVNGVTPALLLQDHYYDKAKANGIDIEVQRSRLGNGRTEVETYHTQTPRRTTQMAAAGDTADMWRLASIFHSCAGSVKALWYPSAYAPARLTANPSAGSTSIQVDDASLLGGHPYICLRNGYGVDAARYISGVSGNTLVLESAPASMDYTATSLQLLYLGRFKGDELTITYKWSDYSAKLDLVELPPDYSAPAGEVYGSSYGAVDPTAKLFQLTDAIGTVYRWTNYESAISYGGNTYEPRRISHGRIKKRLNLDDGNVTLTCDSWLGNPLMRLIIPRRGQQFTVKLLELDLVTNVATTLWAGTARSAKSSGRILTVNVVGDGRIMEQLIPRQLMGRSCPWIIYDESCGLTPASNAKTGTLLSQVSTYVIRVQLGVEHAAHFFAGGWVQRANPNGGSPTWAILDSAVSSSGALDITIDAILSPAISSGESVTLYPGCDCSFEACTAHANTANFGGFQTMPNANPAFVAIKNTTTTGKK